MAKSKQPQKRKPRKKAYQPTRTEAAIAWFAQVVARLVDRFGWPGAALILGYVFVVKFATSEQKQEIVARYVLGKGVDDSYALLILGSVFAVIVAAQYVAWSRHCTELQREIDRLSAWKTKYQEDRIEGLHHSEPRGES